MKAFILIATLVAVLGLAHVAQAADLQAGWYANVSAVGVYTYGDYGLPYLRGYAPFDIDPGDHYPFQVTDGPFHNDWTRFVSVPTNVYGVGFDNSLTMPIRLAVSDLVAYLSVTCETNYDPNSMILEFWRQNRNGSRDLLWSQLQGGLQHTSFYTAYDSDPLASYYFRVAVVPEPAGLVTLTCGIVTLGLYWRRRK